MIDPENVSAVLVTRGNVSLEEIVGSILYAGITDIVIWDNSQREDVSCFGRYRGIGEARHPYIYHQDDDLVAPVADLLAEYDPDADAETIVANNPDDEYWRLTGRGAIFHRSLVACFDPFVERYGRSAGFHRIADVVFAYSNPYRSVDLGWTNLPWATDPDRMYLEPFHYAVREEALARVRRMHGDQARLREPL